MKTLYYILLTGSVALASQAVAPPATSWWERPLVAPRIELDAEALLASALHQEKALGNIDSALTQYRQVLRLHSQHRATASTARRARSRLAHLESADLTARPRTGSSVVPRRVTPLVRVARSLQISPARAATTNASAGVADPFGARRRWLSRSLRLRGQTDSRASQVAPALLAIGHAAETMRSALGLRGIAAYVENQLRQSRDRSMTPHELLLAAMDLEQEHEDFDGATRRYRELVQLNLTGGIATHLNLRARLGLERCENWQRSSSGS
ncbi:MAG: hypothetical protein HOB49_12605 [Gemmatimonadetes bacterium]|nr:hypothetical protein [Gemmatimonadota bacterium]